MGNLPYVEPQSRKAPAETDLRVARQKWPTVRLGEVLQYEQPQRYIVKSEEYFETGVPVLTPGKTFVLGFTDETDGVCNASNTPIILFDDFLTISRYVDFDFKVKSSAVKLLFPANPDCCDLKYVAYFMEATEQIAEDHARHWISETSHRSIPLPPLPEQRRIASALSAVDARLDALSTLASKQDAIKKSTLSLLMCPKIGWRPTRLGDVCKAVSWNRIQMTPKKRKYVPIVTQGEDSDGAITTSTMYLNVQDPLILFGDHTCNVKFLTGDCRIEGDGVKLFAPHNCNPAFLFHAMKIAASRIPSGYARHLSSLKENDFYFPDFPKQNRIATSLVSIDKVIEATRTEQEKTVSLKKGLMRHFFG
jgi:type I restriction enzyme S subunit